MREGGGVGVNTQQHNNASTVLVKSDASQHPSPTQQSRE